jgi:hypothetical protein
MPTYSATTKTAKKFTKAVYALMESEKYGMDWQYIDIGDEGGDYYLSLELIDSLGSSDSVGEYETGEPEDNEVIWKKAHEFYDDLKALAEKHGLDAGAVQAEMVEGLWDAELWTPNDWDEETDGDSTGNIQVIFTPLCVKKRIKIIG